MKIALFGATGTIGRRILKEALARGHRVTAIVRDLSNVPEARKNLEIKQGDIFDPANVAAASAGQDVVISAYGPGAGDPKQLAKSAASLIEGVKRAGGPRLIAMGGAGSLEVAPGVQLADTPGFPAEWKAIAGAHRDALDVFRESDVNWTSFSPAAFIEPGERTGQYRTGTEQLVTDESGQSRISAEDYAVALLDEVENPRFVRKRFTAAY